MATHPELGMDTANWKREGDRFYGSVITKARSTSTEVASAKDGLLQVDLPGRTTSDYGTGLHYQPGGDKYEDFLNGRSVADGRILTPGKETTFERNALDKGLSVVTGASGSTNIMVHLNNYLAAKDPAYSPSQAYLNTLAFLVFDGGHSVNESLAVYRALQESGMRASRCWKAIPPTTGIWSIWLAKTARRRYRLHSMVPSVRTLEFYQQHAYTAQLDELVALGTPRKGDTLADGELPASSGKPVSVANDGSAPLDKQPLNPLTRFLNDNLYGTRDERRQVGDITRQLLDHAVSKGEAEQVTLQGMPAVCLVTCTRGRAARDAAGWQARGGAVPARFGFFRRGAGRCGSQPLSEAGCRHAGGQLAWLWDQRWWTQRAGVYQDARTMFRYLVEERGVAPGKILITRLLHGRPHCRRSGPLCRRAGQAGGRAAARSPHAQHEQGYHGQRAAQPGWSGGGDRQGDQLPFLGGEKPRRPAQEHAHHVADRQRGARQ